MHVWTHDTHVRMDDDWMDGWMAGWLTGWLAGLPGLPGWLAGRMDGWLTGWLAGLPDGWMDGLDGRLDRWICL